MTPDEMTTTLSEHGEPIPHSESGPTQPFRFWLRCQFSGNGCEWESSHVSDRDIAFREHRAHLAAVLAATVTEAQAGALREAADEVLGVVVSPGLPSVHRLAYIDGLNDAEAIVRARADSLVDRAERGQG